MALTEQQRAEIYSSLADTIGQQEAEFLMAQQPPGGWERIQRPYFGDGHPWRNPRGAFDFHGVPDFERLVAHKDHEATKPNRVAGRDKSRLLRDQKPQR